MAQTGTALRICPLCEATCGLTLTIDNGRVTGARGDREDVFSHGFICPKGATIAELDNDPDRLARPMVRRDGVLTEATWDEAYAVIAERLGEVIRDHGGTSVGVYLGNPNAHTIAGSLYAPLIVRALGPRHVYTASTLDQMPKHVALGYLFGSPVAFTVPDLDRTDYLVIIGANPLVSNGPRARAQMPRCCSPSCTCCSKKALSHRISVEWQNTSLASSKSAPWPTNSHRRPSPPTAVYPPKRSASWPARSPPPRPRRSTAESVPPQSNSAPLVAGWSTSSTS